jgi:succinate dehydrogenase / fumarate reductase, cytochrome b subunit
VPPDGVDHAHCGRLASTGKESYDMADTTAKAVTDRGPAAGPARRRPVLVELYGTSVGKKYAMAITGIVGMGYVFAHMIGNLKIYLGAESFDHYAHWLREGLLTPILPETVTLWIFRLVLIAALVIHVHAAYGLTVTNQRARPVGYEARRDYVTADFAARTMRWTGVIVLLFIGYHLADLTWGTANPEFVRGEVYANVVASFSRPLVSAFYIIANIALGVHLYHGAWSLFQSLGINSPRYNHLRRGFAVAFAAIIVIGNVSFPVAVMTGIVA